MGYVCALAALPCWNYLGYKFSCLSRDLNTAQHTTPYLFLLAWCGAGDNLSPENT